MIETAELSEYVDVRTACTILGVCRASLDNYARAGKLTRYEQGAPVRIRYKRAQLEVLKRIKPKHQ